MIYYFSGTGNSAWVAEELARKTDDQAMDLAPLMKDGPIAVFAGGNARIGIVFPVYAWGTPLLVERFCKAVTVQPDAYAFAVCTCGGGPGKSMKRLRRFFPWQGAWSLTMPGNYIVGYDADPPELQQQLIAAAQDKIPQIAEAILANSRVYDVKEGSIAGLKTTFVRPLFNAFARRTRPFYATNACNGCGLCARICPIGAIRLENGKPQWIHKHCTQCLGCINRCPQEAIQFGAQTAARQRYFFRQNQ